MAEYRDQLSILLTTELSFWDRLRVLVGGTILTHLAISTEHVVGQVLVVATTRVPPLFSSSPITIEAPHD